MRWKMGCRSHFGCSGSNCRQIGMLKSWNSQGALEGAELCADCPSGGVLKEEFRGKNELSCRLGYILQLCICATHLFK